MASTKTATLTFRIESEISESVRMASINQNRSTANMIALVTRDYCGQVRDEIQAPEAKPAKISCRPKTNCNHHRTT